MRFYDHPDREKAKEAFEAAMAADSGSHRGEPRIASARDLLALFRELLLSPGEDP